jgi:hypothetical protein
MEHLIAVVLALVCGWLLWEIFGPDYRDRF